MVWRDTWWRVTRGHPPRVGLALGVFDFCHAGHINLLRRAARRCDKLVVAVHTDREVIRYKGVLPANSERERTLAVRELGLAHAVVLDSDRERICRRFGVNLVFHGDDWPTADYIRRWGEDCLRRMGARVEMLPHTPGVTSRRLQAEQVPVAWWLYSSRADWSRAHVLSHVLDIQRKVGGTWVVHRRGRDEIRRRDRLSPVILPPDGTPPAAALAAALERGTRVVVVPHFNYAALLPTLAGAGRPVHLVVLSHGRSGKPGTSAEVHAHPPTLPPGVTLHDWSYLPDSYVNLDGFLARGGSFTNPVPPGSPRVLLLPTWGPRREERGLLLSHRWRSALKRLAREVRLELAPHPLLPASLVREAAADLDARLLPADGRSSWRVPRYHAVVADLSGALWEALLFDTPVVLADAGLEGWPADRPPSPAAVRSVVPVVPPGALTETVLARVGRRESRQRALAEARLGRIDGRAGERLAERILELAGPGECVQQSE